MFEAVSTSFSEDLETKALQKAARVLKQSSTSGLRCTHVEILDCVKRSFCTTSIELEANTDVQVSTRRYLEAASEAALRLEVISRKEMSRA
jgi:hypothetical protein